MTTIADSKLSRTSISYIALRTPEVEAAAQFYADAMGLAAEPVGADGSDAPDGLRLGWGSGHYVLELLPGAPVVSRLMSWSRVREVPSAKVADMTPYSYEPHGPVPSSPWRVI